MCNLCRAGATEAAKSGKRIAEALSEGAAEGMAEPHSAPASAEKTDAWKSVEQAAASTSAATTQPASPGIQQARVRELIVRAASTTAWRAICQTQPQPCLFPLAVSAAATCKGICSASCVPGIVRCDEDLPCRASAAWVA